MLLKLSQLAILGLVFVLIVASNGFYIRNNQHQQQPRLTAVNGGIPCATCAVLVTLTEELAIVHNETVEKALNRLCNYLPDGFFRTSCYEAVSMFGDVIINGIYAKESADVICHSLNICHTDKGQPECHIYPKPNNGHKMAIQAQVKIFHRKLARMNITINKLEENSSVCDLVIFKEICAFLQKIFSKHDPAEDVDGDHFSTYSSLRGSSWRGKDCNDYANSRYPGVKPKKGDIEYDSNCNGIYGQVPNASISYEDLFCKNSTQMGIGVLGDSISAHFHLPEEWFDATKLSKDAFLNLAFIIENEIDWPQLSAITGYMNSTWPVTRGPTRSLYNNLWNRNKCNFRDFQNIAVNGADTNEILGSIMKSLSRNQRNDQPMILFYSSVGNDVCNGNPDTVAHMTKPDVFYNNIVSTMEYLDTILPKGSHVMLTGLANGSILYEQLGNRVYPLGQVKQDIKYSDFYTYLSCLQLSPCNGWMTTNATLRKLTSDYAEFLSTIVKNISLTKTFTNFDLAYTDFPIDTVIKKWKAQGGQVWELIEPIDGFHMNQIANAMVADEYWDIIQKGHPDWLGQVNPFNDAITKVFGDQGGY